MVNVQRALEKLSSFKDLLSSYQAYVSEATQGLGILNDVESSLRRPNPDIDAASAKLRELSKLAEPYIAMYPAEARDVLNRISDIQSDLKP